MVLTIDDVQTLLGQRIRGPLAVRFRGEEAVRLMPLLEPGLELRLAGRLHVKPFFRAGTIEAASRRLLARRAYPSRQAVR